MPHETLRHRLVKSLLSKKGTILTCSVLLLLSAIFLVQAYGKAYREDGYDYTSYLLSSNALLDGANPYHTGSPFPFIYPLFLCVALIPLAVLPYWFSNLLWYLGNSVALYFSVLVLLKHHPGALSERDIRSIVIVPLLLLVNVIQNNLLNGQVNFTVLLLCTLFLHNYHTSHKISASLFLSAAIAVKLTPLILLVYLLCRKDFFMSGLVALNSLVLCFLLPSLIGGTATIDYYSEYVNSFLMNQMSSSVQTPQGFAYSLTSIIGFFIPSISKVLSFIIACVISLTPIVIIQSFSRSRQTTGKETTIFSLYMLAILLIGPMSETHHLIYLLPAASLATVAMLGQSQRHFYAGLLVLGATLLSLICGRFYFPANIGAVLALYALMFWLFSQRDERARLGQTEGADRVELTIGARI